MLRFNATSIGGLIRSKMFRSIYWATGRVKQLQYIWTSICQEVSVSLHRNFCAVRARRQYSGLSNSFSYHQNENYRQYIDVTKENTDIPSRHKNGKLINKAKKTILYQHVKRYTAKSGLANLIQSSTIQLNSRHEKTSPRHLIVHNYTQFYIPNFSCAGLIGLDKTLHTHPSYHLPKCITRLIGVLCNIPELN